MIPTAKRKTFATALRLLRRIPEIQERGISLSNTHPEQMRVLRHSIVMHTTGNKELAEILTQPSAENLKTPVTAWALQKSGTPENAIKLLQSLITAIESVEGGKETMPAFLNRSKLSPAQLERLKFNLGNAVGTEVAIIEGYLSQAIDDLQKMLPKKLRPQRKIIALTLNYLRRHPEIIEGKKINGRIALSKRGEFDNEFVKIVVEDKELASILTNNSIENPCKQIAEYFMQKYGSKEKAVEELNKLTRTIEKNTRCDYTFYDRIAKIMKLHGEDQNQFLREFQHMISSANGAIQFELTRAKWLLQKLP